MEIALFTITNVNCVKVPVALYFLHVGGDDFAVVSLFFYFLADVSLEVASSFAWLVPQASNCRVEKKRRRI